MKYKWDTKKESRKEGFVDVYIIELISGIGSWWAGNPPGCGSGWTLRGLQVVGVSIVCCLISSHICRTSGILSPHPRNAGSSLSLPQTQTINIGSHKSTKGAPFPDVSSPSENARLSLQVKLNKNLEIESLISFVPEDNPGRQTRLVSYLHLSKEELKTSGAGRTKQQFQPRSSETWPSALPTFVSKCYFRQCTNTASNNIEWHREKAVHCSPALLVQGERLHSVLICLYTPL